MTKNTKGIIWASVAILAVVVSGVTYARQLPKHTVVKNTSPIIKVAIQPAEQSPITTPTETATSSPITAATSTPVKIVPRKPKPATISYGDAVTKYGFNRIQFAPGCLQASPNQIATANPVTFMLDNRSDAWQAITIGSHTYNVAPYNYVIATVNEKILPVNLYISCNQQKNVALIILQK